MRPLASAAAFLRAAAVRVRTPLRRRLFFSPVPPFPRKPRNAFPRVLVDHIDPAEAVADIHRRIAAVYERRGRA
ncbi:MAG: hypothetical protein IIA41_03120 [SAR324 cluster bacterium]|nr:hypothetical protein [SAR324 cluster bacterium]